jgi:hypothetical protein
MMMSSDVSRPAQRGENVVWDDKAAVYSGTHQTMYHMFHAIAAACMGFGRANSQVSEIVSRSRLFLGNAHSPHLLISFMRTERGKFTSFVPHKFLLTRSLQI